jgi:hypothetical protein
MHLRSFRVSFTILLCAIFLILANALSACTPSHWYTNVSDSTILYKSGTR